MIEQFSQNIRVCYNLILNYFILQVPASAVNESNLFKSLLSLLLAKSP